MYMISKRARDLVRPTLLVLLLGPLSVSPAAAACDEAPERLCLGEGRFAVEVDWRDFQGNQGIGQAQGLTPDTGYFWFFDSANVELVVKVLDGRAINGHFWVFYGSLSNVGYTLTVTDTATGRTKSYENPPGRFASVGDTQALSGTLSGPLSEGRTTLQASSLPGASARSPVPTLPEIAPSTTSSETLLLGGRFRVQATWRDFQGNPGTGRAVGLTSDTGYFWFFDPANVELVVKVLDARAVNGRFWVFYGALSNVEFTLTVTDTRTGVRSTYTNPAGRFASVGDTDALTGRPLPGVGFTPRYFASIDRPWLSPDNVREHLTELDELGLGLFGIHGQWWEVADRDGRLGPPFAEVVADLPDLERRLVAHLQFTDPNTGVPRFEPGTAAPGAGWEEWEAQGLWSAFTEAAVSLARRQRPPFLGIGVEITEFARRFPAAYDRFAGEIFPDIVRRVAEVSPDTVVFPGFQFELMMGDLRGVVGPDGEPGCAGCVPPAQANSLSGRTHPDVSEVLNRFPPEVLTHVGFTTYPYFNRDFATPDAIPEDYYSRLFDRLDEAHQDVHLLFTESGWPAVAELSETEACLLCTLQHPESTATCHPQVELDTVCTRARIEENIDNLRDWLGDETEQLAFVERFAELTEDLHPALVVWTLLHDADERFPGALSGLFGHIGFRTHDGTVTRPSFDRWLELWPP